MANLTVGAPDAERAAEQCRREEAQRAYDEELKAMLDKAKAMRGPRVTRL